MENKVNRYLVVAILILLFMVLDQAHALRQVTQLNEVYSASMTDYWNYIQKNCKKE